MQLINFPEDCNNNLKIKIMKKISFLFLFVILFSSCNFKEKGTDLLENIEKWKGDNSPEMVNNTMLLSGEYKSYIYNNGIFRTFENFELTAKIQTETGACAAILFHTNKKNPNKGYEVIIDNSAVGNWDKLLKTGSLSSIRNIYYNMVDDGEWFDLKIKVEENHIKVDINNYPVVDYIEPEMPFRVPETLGRKIKTGTFAIKTLYGNTSLKIKELKVISLPKASVAENEDSDFTRRVTMLHTRNLPLVDYHVHEKGDLTLPLLIERSAKLGINYGVAANCGLKFPIQTDDELRTYLESIKGMPIFKAMQAEGREWVEMFSHELVHEFDYAFTDAMTWTNRNGVRMRLWIPEETNIGDPDDFMEQLVAQIEKVVTEPISIYVNPTYLPVEIEDQYEELWTDERIDRIVKALKNNNVALEINSRLHLPGSRIIAKAKEAGVKFAMGTNNTDSENLGNLEWALNVIKEHNLQATDMFLPGEK